MIGRILMVVFILAIITAFALLCAQFGQDLENLNEEMRELKRRQKEREK